MPGAEWFPGARLSYADHVFRDKDPDAVAIRHASELRDLGEWTWADLREETGRMVTILSEHGVGEGDRVAAYMPNIPETVAAFLATASLGAIWSSAAPEFGARSVIDRFSQIEPKVLLAIDGYRYGGKDFDRTRRGEEHRQGDRRRAGVEFGYLKETRLAGRLPSRASSSSRSCRSTTRCGSSTRGTTGLPKSIVQGQGGILLEHLKKMHLHVDAQEGDRVFWFSTTGWMMWNFLVGVLLTPASIVLYDGNPGRRGAVGPGRRHRHHHFGTSASFIAASMKEEIEPADGRDLSALDAVGSTGSPLSPEGFSWVYDKLGEDTWLFSTSGGTDVCTAFVGGVPCFPSTAASSRGARWAPRRVLGRGRQRAHRRGRRAGDHRADALDAGLLLGRRGRLALRESYFDDVSRRLAPRRLDRDHRARHGDHLRPLDSTINRGGVRMGTSEIYRAVLAVDEITDALVVDVPREGQENDMPLFVVLREGASSTRT